MKKKLFFLYIIFCVIQITQAQNNTLDLENSDVQIGIDYKDKSYIVFNGFKFFYKKNFSSKVWKTINYKFNQLPITNDFPYNFYNINGKNYLVNTGCGEVYELKNDSIVRVDNSFQQKNQYNSNTFVYKNEIYYFGGYGLFTHKNILTKFDFKTKEWELVKYKDYTKIPEPRQAALSFLKEDLLYVISGYTEDYDTNQTTGNSKILTDIWKLNLKTMKWDFVGNISSQKELLFNFNGLSSYQTNSKLIYDNNRLFEFDFETNTLSFTKPKDKYLFSFNEKFNYQTNEIIYALKSSNQNSKKSKIIIEPFQNYNDKITSSEDLVADKTLIYASTFLSVLALFTLIFYLKLRKKPLVTKNCIFLKENTFYYQDKPINNLSLDESELLNLFFKNYKKPLQMNEVVDFFSKKDGTNYNALTKKKDAVINSLKQKMAFVLDVSGDDLFICKKNNEDKRIKEIQLNPLYFKV